MSLLKEPGAISSGGRLVAQLSRDPFAIYFRSIADVRDPRKQDIAGVQNQSATCGTTSTSSATSFCNSDSGIENCAKPQFGQTKTCGKTHTVRLVNPS
jgi:hypothetical protein